jgi:hypothetical protein
MPKVETPEIEPVVEAKEKKTSKKEVLNIRQKLSRVQLALKAPKGQYNSFGKYYYRNNEDIFEAVKPLLEENELTMVVSDELVNIGERYYVKATVAVLDIVTGEMIATHAYAREELDKKGMDGSQITGASSSYARKYAANGMFLIDDTKDSDTTNTHGKTEVSAENKDKLKVEQPVNTDVKPVVQDDFDL